MIGLLLAVLFAASDVPVRQTVCGGVGVTRFGHTFVYDGAPDLMEDVSFQEGNENPREKVTPKETRELTFNYVGADATRMPISSDRAELYEEPVNLIDGDAGTTWLSHGQMRADGLPDVRQSLRPGGPGRPVHGVVGGRVRRGV